MASRALATPAMPHPRAAIERSKGEEEKRRRTGRWERPAVVAGSDDTALLFAGGGEMGALMRDMDWSASSRPARFVISLALKLLGSPRPRSRDRRCQQHDPDAKKDEA